MNKYNRKRDISTLAVIIFLIVLSACKQYIPSTKESNINLDRHLEKEQININQTITVGFSMDTLAEERWERDRELFREAVESLGADVKIFASQGDDALQILQAETMIQEGIDVLVIVPHHADSTAMIVNKAHAAGIKVLSYDRLVRNAEIDLYVSYDNELIGELQATEMVKMVPKGRYVYIGGAETDNNAHILKRGVFKVLQPYIESGDITIIYDQWTKDWYPEHAYENMKEALRVNNNKIDAVICANDATANQVIMALDEHGLAGKIPVIGQDADLSAVQHIVVGTQTMTIYKPLKELAMEAAELAIKLAKDEKIHIERTINNGKTEIPSVLLLPTAVSRMNINETIIADKFHSREEVYKE